MQLLIALLFFAALLCFLFDALGAKTPARLTQWGLAVFVVGVALALKAWTL